MDFITQYFGADLKIALLVIANLILLESILSVDNAVVLASIAHDLPPEQQKKALNYGIVGAYIFRVIALIFASILYQVVWLKALGAMYLMWLGISHLQHTLHWHRGIYILFQFLTSLLFIIFDPHWQGYALVMKIALGLFTLSNVLGLFTKSSFPSSSEKLNPDQSPLFKLVAKYFGTFWATIAIIQFVDLAFSLDNIFAAVAYTDKLGLIIFGVLIGIMTIRIAAEVFLRLLEKYPIIENIAFFVIFVLGIKLSLSYLCAIPLLPYTACHILESHTFDLLMSVFTISCFTLPILYLRIYSKQ